MSQTEFDQLLDQLTAGDAESRRTAAKRLGQLKRPEAIPELASVYHRDDDESVRDAAAEALRAFRRMEQQTLSGDLGEVGGGGNTAAWLVRLRTVLLVTLAITVLGNIGIRVSRLLPSFDSGPGIQTTPQAREVLVEAFKLRIQDARTETGVLREVFTGVQGMGFQALNFNQDKCKQLQESKINEVKLGNKDYDTYPDLRNINDQINLAAQKLVLLRNDYTRLCILTDKKQFDNELNAIQGVGTKIGDVDQVTRLLDQADSGLKRAVTNPEPTIGASATPTIPPTLTPVVAPTQAPTTPAAATRQATGPATRAASLPETLSLKTFGYEKLKSYRYRVSLTINATGSDGKKYLNSLTMVGLGQNVPIQAQFDITVVENPALGTTLKALAGDTFFPGETQITVMDKDMYASGALSARVRPGSKCLVIPLPGGEFQPMQIPQLQQITLQLQPASPNDPSNTRRYRGEKKTGNNSQPVEEVEAFVLVDKQIPVKVVWKASQPVVGKVAAQTRLSQYAMVFEYELLGQDVEVKIARPTGCTGAGPATASR